MVRGVIEKEAKEAFAEKKRLERLEAKQQRDAEKALLKVRICYVLHLNSSVG